MQFIRDIIPAKARKYVYGVAALLSLAYGVWQASGGDWDQFVASLLASLVATLAGGNVNDQPPPES